MERIEQENQQILMLQRQLSRMSQESDSIFHNREKISAHHNAIINEAQSIKQLLTPPDNLDVIKRKH